MVKHPLQGVATSLSRAIVAYNVAHNVPHNIFTKMMGWISYENTDNKVRENSFKPLAKQFFKELISPSSWVECDSHLNTRGRVFKRIKNKTLLEAALAWEDEDAYKDHVTGKLDVKWAYVDFVYMEMNISEHWMVLAMDMNIGHIFVFDSLPSYTPMKKLVN
ncbi:uncharacterized protein LOC120092435 [Benincasa hispida]|uniref:uncharacterized protein LOC120092435 n=1 Tax=Benincasa hispida TaxID=102211 RepID=UPI0018FF204E|nr:uncharacterized protein LOC120092435 [Benincasa hispida]